MLRSSKLSRLVAGLVCLAVLSSACNADSSEKLASTTTTPSTTLADSPEETDPEFPDYSDDSWKAVREVFDQLGAPPALDWICENLSRTPGDTEHKQSSWVNLKGSYLGVISDAFGVEMVKQTRHQLGCRIESEMIPVHGVMPAPGSGAGMTDRMEPGLVVMITFFGPAFHEAQTNLWLAAEGENKVDFEDTLDLETWPPDVADDLNLAMSIPRARAYCHSASSQKGYFTEPVTGPRTKRSDGVEVEWVNYDYVFTRADFGDPPFWVQMSVTGVKEVLPEQIVPRIPIVAMASELSDSIAYLSFLNVFLYPREDEILDNAPEVARSLGLVDAEGHKACVELLSALEHKDWP